MDKNTKLPDFWTALVILLFLFLTEVLLAAAFYDFAGDSPAGDPARLGVLVLANGVVFTVIMKFTGLTYADLFHRSHNSVGSVMVVLGGPILLVTVGANWWFAGLCELIVPAEQVSEAEYELLVGLVQGGVVSFITVGIVAPVLEEMLFRGVLLRGFLEHYKTVPAILLSAVVFAGFHFTLSQLPVAFGLGCFVGWLYWRTRSLWPCILAHMFYNMSIIVIYAHIDDISAGFESDVPLGERLGFDAGSFLVSAYGVYLLWKLLHGTRKPSG